MIVKKNSTAEDFKFTIFTMYCVNLHEFMYLFVPFLNDDLSFYMYVITIHTMHLS